jgi:alkylation response protein AidB-like acyl-CoA dehydrogenase
MSYYTAPVDETFFILKNVLRIDDHKDIEAFSEISDDVLRALLEGAGRFSECVLAPLNGSGDEEGCTLLDDGTVITPAGFRDAFHKLVEGGWNNLAVSPGDGGTGLPYVVAAAVEEYLNGGNQAFCMYSNWGFYGSMLMRDGVYPELRRDYLAKLVAGEWIGTMAMTEPHAGTDLGLMRTKAVQQPDGSFHVTGSKVFISGGDHDLTPNIVHFVLARIEGAPLNSRGISLFLVPKIAVDGGGTPGEPNGVSCGSVEHKMGLRASATCTMHFENAKGWLISKPNQGLKQMFHLMNHTRRLTGVIAIAGSDAAYQRAAAYVKERVQGRGPKRREGADGIADPLIEQPDVRRVLMAIRSFIEPGRALVLWMSLQLDLLERSSDAGVRKCASDRISLLTPIVKAVLSDMGYEATILAQQMFGGHGYIVDTGIEQYSRDLRMLSLAEGANGVQAMDLVGRKLLRDEGAIFTDFIEEVRSAIDDLPPSIADLGIAMSRATDDVVEAAAHLLAIDRDDAGYGAYDFMTALGVLALGYMWILISTAAVRSGVIAQQEETPFRLARARFFMSHHLTKIGACLKRVKADAEEVSRLPAEAF